MLRYYVEVTGGGGGGGGGGVGESYHESVAFLVETRKWRNASHLEETIQQYKTVYVSCLSEIGQGLYPTISVECNHPPML